jgi:BCD family chlorophyll transporter-like MFS transporter
MVGSGIVFSLLLSSYSHTRLAQVVQGAAVATMVLNLIALWKQEPRTSLRRPGSARTAVSGTSFRAHWQGLAQRGRAPRFLLAVGLGTLAFNMQDIILEPYGGEVLGLPVGDTTLLTGIMATGALLACVVAARRLARGADPHAVAAWGAVAGLAAFAAVIFAAPLQAPWLFRAGAMLIGFGGGLFAVGTLIAAMALDEGDGMHGLVIGAWGAVQATCAGASIALGGALRDLVGGLAQAGALGESLTGAGTGYGFVYHVELALLFATLVVIGPLVQKVRRSSAGQRFGLAEFPG